MGVYVPYRILPVYFLPTKTRKVEIRLDEFWRSTKRYVVCKGSRASKKSTTAALKLIVRLMQYPLANAIVIRKTLGSLANSCYAQLKWAINRLGVGAFWKCTVNPLQLTYLPTGQKILFYGLDEPQKVTSVTVEKGFLCYAWLEEAFQCEEEEFKFIDESLRGEMPEGYYDVQQARNYAKLAYCLQKLGRPAEARQAAEAFALWRIVLAQRRLHQKNRTLFDTVQQLLKKEEDTREKALAGQSFETLTASQQLYRKTCDLMRDKQPYTESTLNREAPAQMLGTNYNLVADAIRECTGGMTLSDFLDDWRIRHAAQMLADTDDPVGLVTEMSGFASRSHFNTLFREKFKMTPTEYRKVAKEKKG